MPSNVIDEGVVSFTSEGRLLQELGLRLVASPEVALVELIKNAYDADSVDCSVRLSDDGDTLVVEDHGHGMTLNDFLRKWMQIATSSRASQRMSVKFRRPLTGAKGIGRFAVRYLGDHLTIHSVADDKERGYATILKATFDWPKLDQTGDLSQTKVPYQLLKAPEGAEPGTTLTIRKLRAESDFARSRNLRATVLRIVSPLQGLEMGHFHRKTGEGARDPGFRVVLPGDEPDQEENLARLVLQYYWARLTISLRGGVLNYSVWQANRRRPHSLKLRISSAIKQGFFCDVRFFPRRKGVFQGKEVNGRAAWTWVRENSGIGVVDHGFRIKPYGFPDDDWLWLDLDAAHNQRDWRSKIAREHFPIPREIRARPGESPALNLPHNLQLVGAVFIETARAPTSGTIDDLVPAMDREGLLANRGFRELGDYVRGGIEFLALCDKEDLTRLEAEAARLATETARDDIKKAILHIQESTTLTPTDKDSVVKQYRLLADRLEEQEEYAKQSRRSLLTMSLLGVVAGFMTHESDVMFDELEQTVHELEELGRRYTQLQLAAKKLQRRLETFRGYRTYTKLFIEKTRSPITQPFSVAGQVRYVISRFKSFADDLGIKVDYEVRPDLVSPAVPLSAYSGVLLNLYTNALKALIAVRASIKHPRIVFRAWNEASRHVIEILDNGVGVPSELQRRIWDPLYTTTADADNPLGSGMGLGLTLVKQVVTELGGSVSLLRSAPPGFSTCFRVTYPLSGG